MVLQDYLPISRKVTVVVAKAEHAETLLTVHEALASDAADFLLIGDLERIKHISDSRDLDITKADIIDEGNEEASCKAAVQLVRGGKAQVMMKGNVQTSTFTRALLDKSYGLVPPGGVISHVSMFTAEGYHKPFFITDGAINIQPDIEKKIAMVKNAIKVTAALGIQRPKIACIAPVEKVSDKIESTLHARKLVMMQHHEHIFGDAVIEGPFAFDGAMSCEAARIKGLEGEVPGDADILLFHCLDAANGVYKAISIFGRSEHAGILTGLTVPVVLTSRSDDALTRLNSLRFALCVSAAL